ncbi:hypothetical protein NLU13_8374 [Sarocladium strictum]|uniref:Uncharacterized protein n=1 Tax=Sarocladium strictum TaxID=5046 RepID=A0AA39L4K6_SARSR|nr:hypothetical protein NLU13_8374 [Sarocladium strictum]
MGYYNDVPPPGTPDWVMPTFAGIMSASVGLWLMAYVLMARRSLASNATPTPLIILGLNLAWEAVFAFYVADGPLDRIGFACWFLVDVPLVWATLRTIPKSFESQPLVRRHANAILFLSFLAGLAAFGWYAVWWLERPGMGYGDKTGKGWKDLTDRDTTELSFWTAVPIQLGGSIGSVAMVLQRGHSGGHGYAIW